MEGTGRQMRDVATARGGAADAVRGSAAGGRIAYAVLLAVLTIVVYLPAVHYPFIRVWDDGKYVMDNPFVRQGFSWKGFVWAFTSFHASNWHPLTWLSHMLDIQLFGPDPSGHHFVNVLLHATNGVLLFFLLHRLTGAFGRSAFVAALFALHPLHVESVAWVAERKDVLSALFWMITVLLYVRYTERPGAARYGAVVASFACGLMAKPMLVTLPGVLLLIDYWPLGRFSPAGDRPRDVLRDLWRLMGEKMPLLMLSAASSIVTIIAQREGGALGTLTTFPPGVRIANALLSYVSYLGRMVWPRDLSAYYAYAADALPLWRSLGAGALLLAVSVLSFRTRRSYPYLAVGWFWYLGMLLPVIGLVQVGMQAMADRYTYLPLIGIGIIVAWGTADLYEQWTGRRTGGERIRNIVMGSAAAAVTMLFIVQTRAQISTWSSGSTLFRRAVAVSDDYWSRFNLAASLAEEGNVDEAIREYHASIALQPSYANTHYNLGALLGRSGRAEEAVREYEEAVRLDPDHAQALNNLGTIMALRGETARAMGYFQRAVRVRPDSADFRFNIATLLRRTGKLDEAAVEYREALRLAPGLAPAHEGLAMTLHLKGQEAEAWNAVRSMRALGHEPSPALIRSLTAGSGESGREAGSDHRR
jgi:tetratricopeptide (TPR) repeat protein